MEHNKIPINVITGFLGSGKTTLLSEIIKSEGFKNAAIIINEFGQVGIDHMLITKTDENIIELQNGCICCTIQKDLQNTLKDLYNRLKSNNIKQFDRVIIETTGLADPFPISNTLLNCEELLKNYFLENLITVVDAFNGNNTLTKHQEAIKQVSLASVIILTKTDLISTSNVKKIVNKIKTINPTTNIILGNFGKVPILAMFKDESYKDKRSSFNLKELLEKGHEHVHNGSNPNINKHGNNIYSFVMKRELPVNKRSLDFFVKTLEKEVSPYLLRVKGIINVSGESCPAILHGSQNLIHPVKWLKNWPDNDKRTRIIFITFDIKRKQFKGFCESILGLHEISIEDIEKEDKDESRIN